MGVAVLGDWVIPPVLGAITMWKAILLLRAPRPSKAGYVVLALFATTLLSNVFGLASVARVVDGWSPGLSSLVNNLCLIAFFCCFVCFFAVSLGSWRFTSLRIQVGAALAVAAAMTACWAAASHPDGLPPYAALVAQGPPAPYLFYLVGSAYFAYACVAAAVLGWLAARRATSRWRNPFRLCAVGFVLALLGGPVIRVPAIVRLWATGRDQPDWVESGSTVLLAVGIGAVILGLVAVAAGSVAGTVHLWVHSKRGHLLLRPLWRAVHDLYPDIVLDRPSSRLGDLLRVRSVVYRYVRRSVECRDGLWRLSPEFQRSPRTTGELAVRARGIVDAAAATRSGADAAPLALGPTTPGPGEPDDVAPGNGRPSDRLDDRHLIELSCAVRRAVRARARARSS